MGALADWKVISQKTDLDERSKALAAKEVAERLLSGNYDEPMEIERKLAGYFLEHSSRGIPLRYYLRYFYIGHCFLQAVAAAEQKKSGEAAQLPSYTTLLRDLHSDNSLGSEEKMRVLSFLSRYGKFESETGIPPRSDLENQIAYMFLHFDGLVHRNIPIKFWEDLAQKILSLIPPACKFTHSPKVLREYIAELNIGMAPKEPDVLPEYGPLLNSYRKRCAELSVNPETKELMKVNLSDWN